MAKCKVKSQLVLSGTGSNQVSQYHVTFEADDGYQEEQVYICTESELEDATTHFNEQRAQQVAPLEGAVEERVITVKATKKVADIYKALTPTVTES